MSLILRWFYDNGERHRAFFRQPSGGDRELVIAGRGWEATFDQPAGSRLEDLTDEVLIGMARSREQVAC